MYEKVPATMKITIFTGMQAQQTLVFQGPANIQHMANLLNIRRLYDPGLCPGLARKTVNN